MLVKLQEMKKTDICICGEIHSRAFSRTSYTLETTANDHELRNETNERHNNDALYLSSFIDDYDKYAFCIVVDNTIVGYITAILFPSWNTIKVVFIDSFAIEPSMQRKGVGSEALKQFINVFPEGTAMQLMTTKDRPAYAFYQKLGFLDMADLGDYGLRLLIR